MLLSIETLEAYRSELALMEDETLYGHLVLMAQQATMIDSILRDSAFERLPFVRAEVLKRMAV